MVPEDITRLGAVALSRAVHSRTVTCENVMAAYLDRIVSHNPVLNAILYLRPENELVEKARQADMELSQGLSRGWMHGFRFCRKLFRIAE